MTAAVRTLSNPARAQPQKFEFWDRNQRFRYLMMVEIARRLVENPELVKAGAQYLETHMAGNAQVAEHYRLWKSLLRRPVGELVRRWLADTDEGDYLRANPPLFLVIDDETRKRISAEASHWTGDRAHKS